MSPWAPCRRMPGAAALLARERSGGTSPGLDPRQPPAHTLHRWWGRAVRLRSPGPDRCLLSRRRPDRRPRANLNLNGLGDPPGSKLRWPGAFGSAYLYYLVPRVILFREEHSRRVLVPEVDFVTAPGTSPPHVHRPGGPYALVTGRAVFQFDRSRARFRLRSVHPGHTIEEVMEATGFAFDHARDVPETKAPDAETVALIQGPVGRAIAETYPSFAEGGSASALRRGAEP